MTQLEHAPIDLSSSARPLAGMAMLLLVGACWAALVSAAFFFPEETASAITVQGAALVMALVGTFLARPTFWRTGAASFPGAMAGIYAAFAVVSGTLNDSSFNSIVRYVLVFPTVLIFAGVAASGWRSIQALRAGLTFGALTLILPVLSAIDFTDLLNPRYRYFFNLNPNGLGFITAMAGISIFGYFVEHLLAGVRRSLPMILWAGLIVGCVIVLLATKSRTATGAFLGGVATYSFLRMGLRRTLIFGIPALVLGIFAYLIYNPGQFAAAIATVFSFNDRLRGISTGTGRFEAFPIIIREIWWPHALAGVGPGESAPLVLTLAGLTSTHNGLLLNLSEVGLVGTLPLLAWIGMAARNAFRRRNDKMSAMLTALAVAGLLESLMEALMFSMGNAGSLLFMLAITALATRPPEVSTDSVPVPEEEPAVEP